MTTNVQPSATIYQFPVGGRKSLNREQPKLVAETAMPQVAVGGAWYHEAAIQDTKRVSEH